MMRLVICHWEFIRRSPFVIDPLPLPITSGEKPSIGYSAIHANSEPQRRPHAKQLEN